MIELVLVVFLLCILAMATMVIKAGFSIIDFNRSVEKSLREIVALLSEIRKSQE